MKKTTLKIHLDVDFNCLELTGSLKNKRSNGNRLIRIANYSAGGWQSVNEIKSDNFMSKLSEAPHKIDYAKYSQFNSRFWALLMETVQCLSCL